MDVATRDETLELRREKASRCIRNHVLASLGVGLIPSFVVEVASVAAIEVKLIQDLAKIYDFPVPHKLVAYKILISLVGSLGPFYLAAKLKSGVKSVPLAGHAFYAGFLALTNGAAVYAVGKIFQEHYESGGTFLSSKNSTLQRFYKDKFAEGKELVPAIAAEAGLAGKV